jgi:hypothetical protein
VEAVIATVGGVVFLAVPLAYAMRPAADARLRSA